VLGGTKSVHIFVSPSRKFRLDYFYVYSWHFSFSVNQRRRITYFHMWS
jgi:hypothetical protein